MCFVWIWEQTAIISLYSINWLVFITEMECVYCAVRPGPLHLIQTNFHLCSANRQFGNDILHQSCALSVPRWRYIRDTRSTIQWPARSAKEGVSGTNRSTSGTACREIAHSRVPQFQLLMKLAAFVEPEGSFLCLKQPVSGMNLFHTLIYHKFIANPCR